MIGKIEYYFQMSIGMVLCFFSLLLVVGVLSVQSATAEAKEPPTKVEVIDGKLVRDDIVVQTVELPNGRTIEMVQIFPYANKEYVCLGELKNISGGRTELGEIDCFPIKTSVTPTMY